MRRRICIVVTGILVELGKIRNKTTRGHKDMERVWSIINQEITSAYKRKVIINRHKS